jgi:hypothetical protein
MPAVWRRATTVAKTTANILKAKDADKADAAAKAEAKGKKAAKGKKDCKDCSL